MKKLMILLIPAVAGCATPMQSARNPELESLRAEVTALRQEVKAAKDVNAFRDFRRGRRVAKPKDRRNDLPKGVAR